METLEGMSALRRALDDAEYVLVGAGAGLSAAAGFDYSGARFTQWCAPWEQKFGVHDFYSAGFYPYPTREEFWGFWSAMIMANRYECGVGEPYLKLRALLDGKDYFVLTTNVDHQFQLAGFRKERLFYTQGDYGLFQCSRPCCQETYDNEDMVRALHASVSGTAADASLIPHCPRCGREMTTNLRCDNAFVEDAGWHRAAARYNAFLERIKGGKVLFLELGVGFNTPVIIKYPFWQFAHENPRATYASVNYGEAYAPRELTGRSIVLNADVGAVLSELVGAQGENEVLEQELQMCL